MKKISKRKSSNFKIGVGITSVTIISFLVFAFFKVAKVLKRRTGMVADYDKRNEIWEKVAGNSKNLKIEKMNVKRVGNKLFQHAKFDYAIANKKYKDAEKIIDTFTYMHEIAGGYEEETFEDEPYIIPYLASQTGAVVETSEVCASDMAVVILPGGGFGYKSMDGRNDEGKDVAIKLQKNGINAFVLHYRSNPYEYPIPQLDLQRAIKYIKYHAKDYKINPQKIVIMGFSAGGFMVGCHINKFKGNDFFPENYKLDKIDKVDDSVAAAAMIYPAVTLKHNVPMLFAMFDADEVRDKEKREKILEQYDLKKYLLRSKEVPQFIAWGTRDVMVGKKGIQDYIKEAKGIGVEVKEVIAKGQEHGFEQKYYMDDLIKWLKYL